MKKSVLKKESKAGREKKKLSFITDSKAAKKIREIFRSIPYNTKIESIIQG